MKKILSIIVIALFPHLSKAQTTMEEYNYLTKGYAIQMESGLDMKSGYKMVDVMKIGEENELKKLVRTRDESVSAYLIIYTTSLDDGSIGGYRFKEYICIPNPNSHEDILLSYTENIGSNNDSVRLFNIIMALTFGLKF